MIIHFLFSTEVVPEVASYWLNLMALLNPLALK